MKTYFISLILLLSFSVNAGELTEILKKRDAAIKKLLPEDGSEASSENKIKLKSAINDLIDFSVLSKNCLSNHWDKMKKSQRKEFTDLFSFLVKENSVKKLRFYKSDNVSYETEEVKEDSAKLFTVVETDDEETDVEYSFFKDKVGNWRLKDIVIDEVSTERNYRSRFNKIIKKKGLEGLLEKLRKKKKKLLEEDAK